jgi:hypothetical protein
MSPAVRNPVNMAFIARSAKFHIQSIAIAYAELVRINSSMQASSKFQIMDNSYRIYNCAGCSAQVLLCRSCDRGNIYCSQRASIQRRESLRETGTRYQGTESGRDMHAARQARYGERVHEHDRTWRIRLPMSEKGALRKLRKILSHLTFTFQSRDRSEDLCAVNAIATLDRSPALTFGGPVAASNDCSGVIQIPWFVACD